MSFELLARLMRAIISRVLLVAGSAKAGPWAIRSKSHFGI